MDSSYNFESTSEEEITINQKINNATITQRACVIKRIYRIILKKNYW